MAARQTKQADRPNRTAAKSRGRAPFAQGATERANTRPGRTSAQNSVCGRRSEIIALVLFGVAVFLLFVLNAGDMGGFMGRGVRTGLLFIFGRLALLVPLALIAVGTTMVFQVKFWRSYRFLGVVIFVLGLFLLMGAGVPPFGNHGTELFVRTDFELRAGIMGESLYALLYRLVGLVGIAVMAWVAELVGLSLSTGITARRLGKRTRGAAQGVLRMAEASTLVARRRDASVDDPAAKALPASGAWWPATEPREEPPPTSSRPPLGPVDLISGEKPRPVESESTTATPSAFGDAFDEWSDGSPAECTPMASARVGLGETIRGLLDGERAFSDLYQPDADERSVGTATAVAEDTKDSSTVASSRSSKRGQDGAAESAVGPASPMLVAEETAVDRSAESPQETLPGLMRQPRQIELAVAEPSYLLPEPDMLHKSPPLMAGGTGNERDVASVLVQALSEFGVEARVIGMVVGPRVTRYELQLAPGTKVAKVSALKDDLAYALASTEIRILAPIPGKSAVGVEVPNQRPDFVTLGDIYREFPKSAGPLMVWLGKDISGKAVYADLTRLPHLLIAGTTGSGKSGCVNCLVSSVLLRSTPAQVRMIMIDPKKVELSHYDRIPHLLVPVVTNMKDAAGVLHNVVKEMEDRYELMELEHARSLTELNKGRARRGEQRVPYILIVIDELADLMMASPQEVEDYVIRLAQKARAVGIHLVVATQRPSADVITGMIKANIPSRIAFAVSGQTDSRVILDVNGAETLLGMGDMLFKPLGSSHLQRVQGAYITEEEIAMLVSHWRHQAEPEFREELLRRPSDSKRSEEDIFDPDSDELLTDAAQLVIETGSASVSMLQRRLRVGYTRAGRLIDMLERRGIVGPWEGSKPRQILVGPEDAEHVLAVLRTEERFNDGEGSD